MPRLFNAAHDLLERNIVEGRAAKIAYIDDDGRYTYEELCARVNRSANALQKLGLKIEDRVMIVHSDTIDFPSVFLGAIKSSLVVVDYLDVSCVSIRPFEANAPLIVDTNAVLALPITLQSLKLVSRRDS